MNAISSRIKDVLFMAENAMSEAEHYQAGRMALRLLPAILDDLKGCAEIDAAMQPLVTNQSA